MAFKIAYGAGHFLHEPGKRLPKALDANETREWTLNDRVARYFAEAAAQYADVELLRTDDPTGQSEVNLQPRCGKANGFGADMALSIHHNAGANLTEAGGLIPDVPEMPADTYVAVEDDPQIQAAVRALAE